MRETLTVRPATSTSFVTFTVVDKKPIGDWRPIAIDCYGTLDDYDYFYNSEKQYIAVKK